MQRLARGLERGGRQWTAARRKDSLMRLLAGCGGDGAMLHERVDRLLHAWEGDVGGGVAADEAAIELPAVESSANGADAWRGLLQRFGGTLRAALPPEEPRAAELGEALDRWSHAAAIEGATPSVVRQADDLCRSAKRLIEHRQHLLDELGKLCLGLTQGRTELAEDDSWARGQCDLLHTRLAEGLNVRSVSAASQL